MRSLKEREAFRQKQKEQEAKDRKNNVPPEQEPVGSEEDGTPIRPGEKSQSERLRQKQFNAVEFLNGSAESIKSGLEGLSEEQLNELEAKEAEGKKRNSVKDAITKQREANKAKGGGWSSNR